jgi:hypothetical protein
MKGNLYFGQGLLFDNEKVSFSVFVFYIIFSDWAECCAVQKRS